MSSQQMPAVYPEQASSERGHVVLRRRAHDGALELRVNGVFVMDTAETKTERLLASTALDALGPTRQPVHVLIGGLGLGFTLQQVLLDPRVASVVVAEIEPALVDWHRRGLVPPTSDAVHDPRVTIAVADVRNTIAAQPPGSLDLVLLDVDNGPGFLVYDDNAALYRPEFLAACRDVTTPGGVTAIWSADSSEELTRDLRLVFGNCAERRLPVTLGRRETTYHLFYARRHQDEQCPAP